MEKKSTQRRKESPRPEVTSGPKQFDCQIQSVQAVLLPSSWGSHFEELWVSEWAPRRIRVDEDESLTFKHACTPFFQRPTCRLLGFVFVVVNVLWDRSYWIIPAFRPRLSLEWHFVIEKQITTGRNVGSFDFFFLSLFQSSARHLRYRLLGLPGRNRWEQLGLVR